MLIGWNMTVLFKCIYRNRRKWKKVAAYVVLIVGALCLLFYLQLVYDLHGLVGGQKNLLTQTSTNVNLSSVMKKNVMEIKKNLVHIEYFEENERKSSEESFLGMLAAQSNQINIHNASLFPKLIDPSSAHVDPTILKKADLTIYQSKYKVKKPGNRYLFLLGHYEQLGKTVVNFMHAGLLASKLKRSIVLPFVKNSRFCGLKGGWIGSLRQKTREFLPMDNYFDLQSVENLFTVNGLGSISQFSEFQNECKISTMVYFLYANGKAEVKKYFEFNDSEYTEMVKKLADSTGIIDCLNVEGKVQSGSRIQGVKFAKAFCVDVERIHQVNQLADLLNNFECVTVFLWRGIGPGRTHFNLTLPVENYEYYLSQINFSQIITSEAKDFIRESLKNRPYIGVQIRSERQLSWYGLDEFKHCLDLVIKVVGLFVHKKKIGQIFVSSDLEKHGSDQMITLFNKTVLTKAKQYFVQSFRRVSAKFYHPDKRRGLIHNDAGYVALTQMDILSRSSHLITLGAGTFQNWVKARFRKHKETFSHPWSITRVCSVEVKSQKKKRSNIPSTL